MTSTRHPGNAWSSPCLLFLHGWPQDWSSFQSTMLRLTRDCRVAAIDLPGIGSSAPAPASGDKRTLARYVHAVAARQLRLVPWLSPGSARQPAARQLQVHTPVLYLRGGAERGIELERYLAGFREHGRCELVGDVIAGSGHFTPDEQPDALARRIAVFLRTL